ncbi:MAG TPA: hypothetical protein VIZ28_08085 [Chitinophagaceae bacterium]
MKLAYLLAQYLYTNKRLDLPGIGTFKLDSSVIIEPENNRQRPATPDGISFESNSSIQEAPELISYISSKTGKMKALAIADLESHLELAQQFLNIGKPFSFDGIGSLVKIKHGEFEFIPGTVISDKTKDITGIEGHGLSRKETVEAKYQAFLSSPVAKSRWRKPVLALLILSGIALAIWGGYTIATRNSENEESTLTESGDGQTVPYIDSSQFNKPDSSTIQKAVVADSYKYVLEVTNANRAFRRYKQLKETELAEIVRMETKDSLQYKLFVLYPTTTDTTKTINSLTVFLGKKVYIEHQN